MPATETCQLLNLRKLDAAEFHTEPFEYVVVGNFLQDHCKKGLVEDFPAIERKGSFPLSQVTYGPVFGQLVDELCGREFQAAVGRKFSLDLSQYPTMLTVRGWSSESDGQIHTDSKDKLITVLLYLNPEWASEGGRLRLLRSKDLADYVAEVPPTMGSLVIFKRCNRSWHAFRPYEGKRMSLQMNWVKSGGYVRRERLRHRVSSIFKGLTGQRQ